MRSKGRQILNLALMLLISLGLLLGMEAIAGLRVRRVEQERRRQDLHALLPADTYLSLAVDATDPLAAKIEEVYQARDKNGAVSGYLIAARATGYAGDLVVRVAFHADTGSIAGVRLLEHQETAASGAQAALPFFTSRFIGKIPPLFLTGEQPEPEPEPRVLRDGTYGARADHSNEDGYRYTFTMEVEAGLIRDARWDGESEDGAASLRQASANGEVPAGDGALPWHEQAIALESVLLQVQDPVLIRVRADGGVDGAPGITMPVADLLALAEICARRASAPSTLGGTPQDGLYRADADAEARESGYRDYVEIRVEQQRVTAIVWDAEREDGSLRSRSEEDSSTPAGDLAWGEQAARVAAFLLARQDPTLIETQADGTSDEIDGVTLPIGTCLELMRACLLQAGMYPATVPAPWQPDTSRQVDAVAGATLTSRAVVEAINSGFAYWDGLVNASPAETDSK